MITNAINQKGSSETQIDSNNIATAKHDNLNPLCNIFSVDTFKWLKDNGFLDSGFEFHNENIQKLHSFAVSKIHNDPIHREENSYAPSSELRNQDFYGRAFFAMGRGSITSIAESLNEICSWINSTQKNKEGIDPYTFAAEAYIKFIDLHPFEDGNGRTSRLLLNLILIQNDRMPINLKLIDWHNTSLTGYLECLPDDARFFGKLLQNAANGNSTKHYKRYQEPNGKNATLKEDWEDIQTMAQMLLKIREYIGLSIGRPNYIFQQIQNLFANADDINQLKPILKTGINKSTHATTKNEWKGLLARIENYEQELNFRASDTELLK